MTHNTVRDLSPISLSPTGTVGDALKKLAGHKPAKTRLPAGIILVVDGNRKLLGIATNGDINRALASGLPMNTGVAKIMNKDPFVIEGSKSTSEIIAIVADKLRKESWQRSRLDRIILIDKNRKPINIVSFYDLWQASDTRFKYIGIVGLGYVGLTLGLTFADLDFQVKGYDNNPEVRRILRHGKSPFFENGIDTLLNDNLGKRFHVVDRFNADNHCDIYFIAVGTPLDENRKPRLEYIKSAAENVGKVLKPGDLVILRSTVPIGTTRNTAIPILEKESGLSAGEDFFVVFGPERTVEGKALEELRTLPQVLGGINRASANLAASIFNEMTDSIHIVDTLEEAEIVKLINNSYRDVTFAFANEVSLICQKWDIDTNKVINAANMGYSRSNVPKPSPGVGGYCLDKDPYIFMEGARAKGHDPKLLHFAREVNKKILRNLSDDAIKFLKKRQKRTKNPKVFIMGFAFKGRPATSDMRGSTTLELLSHLKKAGFKNIHGYDAVVSAKEISGLGVKAATPKQGFQNADVVIVMNNHEHLAELPIRALLKLAAKEPVLFDTWALYNRDEVAKIPGAQYRHL